MSNAKFTPEMKQTHTILIPDMLPIHFGLIMEIFRNNGYKMELLTIYTCSERLWTRSFRRFPCCP